MPLCGRKINIPKTRENLCGKKIKISKTRKK